MSGWTRHGRYRYRPQVVDRGRAILSDKDDEATPVNPGPIAGFARPLPVQVEDTDED